MGSLADRVSPRLGNVKTTSARLEGVKETSMMRGRRRILGVRDTNEDAEMRYPMDEND